MISPLAVAYRSWLVINERRAREKSKAIKPRCALLTNYPPRIVIASLCQSPWASLARSICIPTFVLQKPRCRIFNTCTYQIGLFYCPTISIKKSICISIYIVDSFTMLCRIEYFILLKQKRKYISNVKAQKLYVDYLTARTFLHQTLASDLIDTIDLFRRFTRNWIVPVLRIAFLFGFIQQRSFTIQSSPVVR